MPIINIQLNPDRPQKIRIKKRFRPFCDRRTPGQVVEDWFSGLWTWLTCMCDLKCSVYRKEFLAAMWGEMGEYAVRLSTLCGIASIILGFVGLSHLPGAIFLVKTKFFIFVAMIAIGPFQFRDLNGPIWWADRYAVTQVERYKDGKEVEHYERHGDAMARLRPSRNLPLTITEIRRLAELYHQFCTGTLSDRSWQEIGEYTAAEMEFFYTVAHFAPNDDRFPEDALKRS